MIDNIPKNMLNDSDREELENLLSKAGFPSLKHLNINYNLWTIATWNHDDVPHFENPRLHDLENIWKEIANTDRKTSVLPLQYSSLVPNILTNVGMADMAKNRTGESSNGTTHVAVGDNATTELVTDTSLGNELDIKTWSEKVVVNQTEKYAGSFVYSDFGTPVNLTEAAGVTAATSGIYVFRVTYSPKSINTGQIMTLQASVQHINGTVV